MMVKKEKARLAKRTRRTRHQILLESKAGIMKSSTVVDENANVAPNNYIPQQPSSMIPSSNDATHGTSNHNQKKSLRILFQEAKRGKLGRRRRSRIRNYIWPRTVEAAQSPFSDATGKNKMFFVLAINLYPDSKIVQPSDTESEEEENINPVQNTMSNDPHFSSDQTGYDIIESTRFAGTHNENVAVEDTDETFFEERSPSPESPKVKRGRRSNNARRIPYGRATDVDHSWRSNYNRRCVQRRTNKQVRNRIKDPQVILDVINTVIERYAQSGSVPTSMNSNNSQSNNVVCGSHYTDVNKSTDGCPRTPPQDLLEENLLFIKQEVASSESSDEEVDVENEDDVLPPGKHIPCNGVPIECDNGNKGYESYEEDDYDEGEETEVVVL